jgi:hypothetical protein
MASPKKIKGIPISNPPTYMPDNTPGSELKFNPQNKAPTDK